MAWELPCAAGMGPKINLKKCPSCQVGVILPPGDMGSVTTRVGVLVASLVGDQECWLTSHDAPDSRTRGWEQCWVETPVGLSSGVLEPREGDKPQRWKSPQGPQLPESASGP